MSRFIIHSLLGLPRHNLRLLHSICNLSPQDSRPRLIFGARNFWFWLWSSGTWSNSQTCVNHDNRKRPTGPTVYNCLYAFSNAFSNRQTMPNPLKSLLRTSQSCSWQDESSCVAPSPQKWLSAIAIIWKTKQLASWTSSFKLPAATAAVGGINSYLNVTVWSKAESVKLERMESCGNHNGKHIKMESWWTRYVTWTVSCSTLHCSSRW